MIWPIPARQHGDELRAAGMTQRQLGEMAADKLERGLRRDPQAPPPPEVKVLEHFGDEKQSLTPKEAADELTNWRDAEKQQEALQELVGEAQQERAGATAAAARAATAAASTATNARANGAPTARTRTPAARAAPANGRLRGRRPIRLRPTGYGSCPGI